MASYFNVFGGNLVQVADPSYLAINLNQNITLSWPSQFQDTNQVVAKIMDVTPDQAGRTITLPDATQVSVGTDFLIVNVANDPFTLKKNDGNILATLTNAESAYFYLTDNSTAAGTWRVIPFGGGFAGVTFVGAATEEGSLDDKNLEITGSPITGAGAFGFSFRGDLGQLISFQGSGTPTGIAVRTGDETWALRKVTIAPNGNLTVENSDGIAGDIILDLASTVGVPQNNQNLISAIRVGDITLGTVGVGTSSNTIITNQTNQDLEINPNGTGSIISKKNVTINTGFNLKLMSDDAIHYVSLAAQNGRTANLNLQWSSAAPVNNQLLQYQVGGIIGWANVPTIADETVVNGIAKFSDAVGSLVSSAVIINNDNSITSPATITATGFIAGNVNITSGNRTISTTAANLIIQPATDLNINSNVYIGLSGGTDNRRTLYFYNGVNTVALAPPDPGDLAAPIKFILPAVIPASTGTPATDQNYLLKCSVSTVTPNLAALSLTDLAGTGVSALTSSKADVVTGTEKNRPVTPLNMGFHKGMPKAWCLFTANVTPVVKLDFYNIDVVRTGVGHYTVTFSTTDMSTNHYAISMCYSGAGVIILKYAITDAHGFDIFAVDTANAAVNPDTISFQVCGIQ